MTPTVPTELPPDLKKRPDMARKVRYLSYPAVNCRILYKVGFRVSWASRYVYAWQAVGSHELRQIRSKRESRLDPFVCLLCD